MAPRATPPVYRKGGHIVMLSRRGLIGTVATATILPASVGRAQQEPIRIGVLNDQSGLYRDFGGPTSVLAARMAVEDFGSNVFGRPIEVIDADHQNKADLASAIARNWFDRQGVTAIADLTNSAAALAVQQLARERGKITLLTGPATTKLTNEECSPTGFHWAFDTYSQATGTAKAMLAEGGKSWFLLAADYAFGRQLAHDLREVVTAGGGQVVGEAFHPLSTPDFASFLLQAQTSKAQVIGLANGGDDTTNAIKQAAEFGITRGGQKLAGLVIVISIVHGLGLETAHGLVFTESFYWDMNEATRAWSKRFFARAARMPGMVQAATYSSVMHYLKSMQAAGTPEGIMVAARMRALPVDDFFAKGRVREDGRLLHDFFLAEVKAPSESAAPWDYYKIRRVIPAEEAAQPLAQSKCTLVR
jgi:branched-chain amino acid transport system substrate-binding protein